MRSIVRKLKSKKLIWNFRKRRIRYNPRTQPKWLLDDEIVDNEYFDTIASVDYGLYVE